MKVALAQVDVTVGDLRGNVARIAAAIREARGRGAELAVFPELAVCGYPPDDLLDAPGFLAAIQAALPELAAVAPELPVLVGVPVPAPPGGAGPPRLNAAVLLQGRQVRAVRGKRLLPSGDVFCEPRYFRPAEAGAPLTVAGRRLGVLICEDLWDEGYGCSPARELVDAGAELLVCLNASPFRRGVLAERLRLARRPGVDLVYVNAVGGHDELVFDGASFVVRGDGALLAQLPSCREAVTVVDLAGAPARVAAEDVEARVQAGLLLGLRDFVDKNRLPGAVVGVSGGVDSALVLALAAEALGPGRVRALHLPTRYTSRESTELSRALCAALGVELLELPLQALHAAAETTLGAHLPRGLAGTAAENVQARLRGLTLMSYVNQLGGVLLNTSNKTELALGYGTLYGDLAGGLSPIGDLTKLEVYAHCRRFYGEVIPAGILERPPTAELRPGQVDPFDYARVAPGVERLVLGEPHRGTPGELAEWGRRLRQGEFKRRQAPPVLKVSPRAFGRGWRMPLTHGWSGAEQVAPRRPHPEGLQALFASRGA
ncbi:MAG: NAD(+) synthase [Planctomycetes bacterium]|nr:NAD(+) synthase [Planctomycetota bacterium]